MAATTRRFLLLLAALCVAPGRAPLWAASLRSSTTLHDANVRMSDLFDDCGKAADIVLGPGPAPGGRIVVEATQAGAIARQFGVAWRASSPSQRVVIDRPGRAVPRETLVASLRAALQESGVGPEATLELGSFTTPLVPPDVPLDVSVEQLDIDPGTGRLTAELVLSAPGEPLQRLRLSGRVQQMAEMVVATHRLTAGVAITAADVSLQRVPEASIKGDAARDLALVIGQAPLHPVPAGQSIAQSELGRPMLVRKGTLVQVQLSAPGLAVSTSGEAVEAGGLGDRIGVLNPASGAVLEAQVMGPDRVQVVPGSTLRRAPRGGLLPASSIQLSQR